MRRLLALSILSCAVGCADTSDSEDTLDGSADTTGADVTGGDGDGDGDGDPSGDGDPTGDGDGDGDGDLPAMPSPTGTCPTTLNGDVEFAPAGIPPRSVRILISEEAGTLDGPVVFYWHGTGSSPDEATYGLSSETVQEILAQGGAVVAPYSDPGAGTFPWYLVTGSKEDDLILADEVLGCLHETVGMDRARIHSIGMSAGGLQTTQMSFRRSNYIASVATYSGGLIFTTDPPTPEPDNKFAAMIFHGGPEDIVYISFQDASEAYLDAMLARDQFAFICDHGNGHTIPADARESVWDFFQTHTWNTVPSPYTDALPAGYPSYCALP